MGQQALPDVSGSDSNGAGAVITDQSKSQICVLRLAPYRVKVDSDSACRCHQRETLD